MIKERVRASQHEDEAATIKKHVEEAVEEPELWVPLSELEPEELELVAQLSELEAESPIDDELDPYLRVHRHQKPPHTRAFCVLLAKVMRALYAADLRGTVVAIATALGHSVTTEDLRYWCGNKRP
jgi:hypothetical protein